MKNFVALISGGKDSFYTIQTLLEQGYTLVACVYIKSNDIDSYMYQTAGQEFIENYKNVLSVPLHIFETKNIAINKDINYSKTDNDEVEIMFEALSDLKSKYKFDFVSSGAIKSTYQLERVKNICDRLNLSPLSPLYNSDQNLLYEKIKEKLDAIFVRISSTDLDQSVIGKNISVISDVKIANKCGEGGEYETLVLDAPFFVRKIVINSFEVECHPEEINKSVKSAFFIKNIGFSLQEK